jgi:hypothetical protein
VLLGSAACVPSIAQVIVVCAAVRYCTVWYMQRVWLLCMLLWCVVQSCCVSPPLTIKTARNQAVVTNKFPHAWRQHVVSVVLCRCGVKYLNRVAVL